MGRCERDVDVAALLDGLARIHRFKDGELARALLQDPGDAEQVFGPFLAGEGAPRAALGTAGGANGLVGVDGRGTCHVCEDLFRGRVDRGEGAPVRCRNLTAVDEQAVAFLDRHDVARLRSGRVVPRDRLAVAKAPAVGGRRTGRDDARFGARDHAGHYGTGPTARVRAACRPGAGSRPFDPGRPPWPDTRRRRPGR